MDEASKLFFHHHPDPMCVFDVETLFFLDANEAAVQQYGYSREEFLALHISAVALPENVDRIRTLVDSRPKGLGNHFFSQHRRKSGEIFNVEISDHELTYQGRPARVFVARDVTRLVQLEQERSRMMAREAAARHASELIANRFQSLFAAVPGKFMVLAPSGFEILAASDAYLQAINARREQLVGRRLFGSFTDEQIASAPDGERNLRQSMEKVIATRSPDAMNIQAFPVHHEGRLEMRYWCAVNSPVLDPNGSIAYIFHRIEDVTGLVTHGNIEPADVPTLLDPPSAFELVLHSRALENRTQQLEAQLAELSNAQDLLALATWSLDADSRELKVSANFHRLMGTSSQTLAPTLEGYLALVHPDDRDTMRNSLEAFCRQGSGHYQLDQRVVRPDGRMMRVTLVGEFRHIAGTRLITFIMQDMTAQFEANQELGRMAMLTRLAGRVARLGGWQYEVATGRLEWDAETFAIFGLPQGKPLGIDAVMKHYVTEYRQPIRDAFEACVATGEPFDELVEFVDANQQRFWVRAIGEATLDAQGRVLTAQGALQDVDELIRARREAESLSHRLAATLESISDAFFTLDRDWRISYLNSQAEQLLNRKRDDLLGRHLWDEFPEARGTLFHTEYERVMNTGETARFDADYPPLGLRFRVSAYRALEGVAVYFSDITQQHRQDVLARLHDERFRLIAKATNDVVWDWDMVNDTLWWNEGMHTLFGHAPETLEPGPESWSRRVHPDDLQRVTQIVEAAIAGHSSTWSAEYRFLHANGTARTIIDRGFMIRDESGRAVRMVGSMLDISERLLLDSQLRQSQKLEAVGHLTGGMAHDFNNLLTVILGNSTVLAERLAHEPRLQSLALMTESAAQRGAELTRRMLAFSRRQALAPKVIEVKSLVCGMEAMFRRTLPEDITLQMHCASGSWPIEVDPGQLEMALLNLVVNARDAMQGGGRLTIETSNVQLDAVYTLRHPDVAAGDYVLIAVTDSGTGIPQELQHQVFDPFFTTKEVGKGTGLGLSMVYGFVKQSNGHVRLYSEPGQGTVVRLYLPRSASAGDTAASAVSALSDAGRSPRGDEHLLVVEDDDLVRAHVVGQLKGLGYRVTDADRGEQALELIRRGDEFALLFTDVVMPGMSGRELAQRVRQLQPQMRVLFTSGYTKDNMVHNGRLESGVHLLSKPYRRRDLAEKIREVLDAPL